MNSEQPGSQPSTKMEMPPQDRATSSPVKERGSEVNWVPWIVACVAVVFVATFLVLMSGRQKALPEHAREEDGYAPNLVFSGFAMSESTSLSGGKSTYLDGRVRNAGGQTVSGATLQVIFANDEALPAQTLSMPLTLIRSREPYVDTQPVGEAPIGPGSEREFRLIFEGIGSNWNQQIPQVRVTHVFVSCNPCR